MMFEDTITLYSENHTDTNRMSWDSLISVVDDYGMDDGFDSPKGQNIFFS